MGPPPDFTVDFIGIGAPRCATTWLYRCLNEHPQLCMSRPKELDFFTDKTMNSRTNAERGWEWYVSRFSHYKRGQLRGEISPSYLIGGAAPHIAQAFPNVKLILFLRHPVEVLFDYYKYISNIRGAAATFEELLEEQPGIVEKYEYERHIREYLRHFRREQIHIRLFDDIQKDSREVLAGVFDFLGVPRIEAKNGPKNINAYNAQSSKIIGKKFHAFIANVLTRTRLNRLYSLALFLRDVLDRIGASLLPRKEQQTLNPETRKRLLAYYKPTNEFVSSFMNRPLPSWNE